MNSLLAWRQDAPTTEDLGSYSEAYFWVRGGNFNRPVMVQANAGVRSEKTGDRRNCWPELNFTFPGPYPECIWAKDLGNWPGLTALEWAGPVPRPGD